MVIGDLSLARGVSGQEGEVRRLIHSLLPPGMDRVEVDALGNLLVGRGLGRTGPVLLLAAHMDEVGLMVMGHAPDGRLFVRQSGGVDPRVLPGKRFRVGPDGIPGVMALPPAHLTRGEERHPLGYRDLRLDIGAQDREQAERWVQVGAMATFDTPFVQGEITYQGKAFDDRMGCFLGLQALAEPVDTPMWVAFTVQEEVGCRGALVAGRAIQPQYAVALEGTVAGDVAGVQPGNEVSRVGGGPVLTVVDRGTVSDRGFSDRIRQLATDQGLPWQDRKTLGGSNDMRSIWPEGAKVASIAMPCRYIHSPSSVTGIDDLENARKLVRTLIASMGEVAA